MSRVLIIDDCEQVRRIVHAVLSGSIAELIEAGSGAEGLQAWAQHRPDLVIVDYEMPELNGAQVTKAIREQERGGWTRTAILMMTSHGDARHVAAAREAGVDGFIAKPLTALLILERAFTLLATSGAFSIDAMLNESAPPTAPTLSPP